MSSIIPNIKNTKKESSSDRICYECLIIDKFGKRCRILVWSKKTDLKDVCDVIAQMFKCKFLEVRRLCIDDDKRDGP